MPPLGENEKAKIIQAIMARRFGDLLEWEEPDLVHTYGANDQKYVDEFSITLRRTLVETRTTLLGLSEEGIRKAEADLANDRLDHDVGRYSSPVREIRWLREHFPPTIASGFGHPKYAVELDYWCSMPELSLKEAVFLSVGASPEAITDRQFEKLLAHKSDGKKLWSAH